MQVDNRLEAAVLLANEALGAHSEATARSLHKDDWESHSGNGEALTSSDFIDSFKRRLLMDTVDMVLASLRPKDAYVVRARFGFLDRKIHPFKSIAEIMGSNTSRVGDRSQAVTKRLREQAAPHFAVFREAIDVVEMADELVTLTPLSPYRVRRKDRIVR